MNRTTRLITVTLGFLALALLVSWAFHYLNQASILYSKGYRFFKHRMHAQALPYFEKAVDIRPKFKDALEALAISSISTGKFDTAKKAYTELLNMNPTNKLAKRGLADVMYWTGQRAEAIAIYEDLLHSNSLDMLSIHSLANALYFEKRYSEAIPLYRKFLISDPSNQEALIYLAESLTNTGDIDGAEQLFTDLEKRQAFYLPALKAIARYHFHKKNYGKAKEYYQRILDSDGKDLESINAIVNILNAEGEKEKALLVLSKAVLDHPKDQSIQLMFADLLARSKRYQQAIAEYKDLLSKWPNDPAVQQGLIRAHIGIADRYSSQDNIKEAEVYYKKAMQYEEALNKK